ncbi:MAG: hypothetical protein K5663_09630 [Clostridiales bacterium]|nr:hypothetical protein [Clostridiales bacterium]
MRYGTPYGCYINGGKEFEINTPLTPRNWYNYFFTDNYVSFTSQAAVGEGFLQDSLGRRIFAVKARGMYLVDGDKGWNLWGLPEEEAYAFYRCVHRAGSTLIELEKHGIFSRWTLFVPEEEDILSCFEAGEVELVNRSSEKRTLKLISYTENDLDGAYKRQGYNTASCFKRDDFNGLAFDFHETFYDEDRDLTFFTACSAPVTAWESAKNAFIGTYGSVNAPAALRHGGCLGQGCVAEKLGYAIQTELTLRPGESAKVEFVCGLVPTLDAAKAALLRFDTSEKFETELKRVYARIEDRRGNISVETPDSEFNSLYNYWLTYQTDMGSRWARVRHNGYRDMASDTECLAAFSPALAWERIKRILSYQYPDGYCPRTFIDGEIRPNKFSDCTVWPAFTVSAIVKALGDLSLLDEEVPFNDGSAATVWEHLKRAADFLYGFKGHYGLIQIWGGDWNDCMNNLGLAHKGVSVWLSIALVRMLRFLRELALLRGENKYADTLSARAEELCTLINRYGWDEKGGRYIYAISDDLRVVGAEDCEEGKAFLNPQTWAILAGGLGEGRELSALDSARKALDTPLGTRVSWPAYTKKSAWIGPICEKAPGVQENGGVYLHAMCWLLAVDCILKREKDVQKDLERILPFTNPVVKGRAEPYALCNCYMEQETGYRYGTPGQSWRTATAQWLLKAVTEFVLGLKPQLEGLKIDPCLPESWYGTKVKYVFRGKTYRIEYISGGEKGVYFEGKLCEHGVLPLEDGNVTVRL